MKLNIACVIVLLSVIITACRKGEEDPFLSFASRKSRISGEWKMTSFEQNWSSHSFQSTISEGNRTGTETTFTEHSQYYNLGITSDQTVIEYSFTINEDGTWESRVEFEGTRAVEDDYTIATTPVHNWKESSGTWAFLNKTKGEYENKERVCFSTLSDHSGFDATTTTIVYKDTLITTTEDNEGFSYTHTYSDDEQLLTYDLLMLSSKKMKWVLVDQGSSEGIEGGWTSESSYFSTETITWEPK